MFQLHPNFFLKNNPEKPVVFSCFVSKWKVIKNSSTSDFPFFNFLPNNNQSCQVAFKLPGICN